MAASSRSWAVVSPGTLCDGWMYKCTPRSARISATVVMVIHTMVTKLNVDNGPTLSKWFFKGTEASTRGTQESTTISANWKRFFPLE